MSSLQAQRAVYARLRYNSPQFQPKTLRFSTHARHNSPSSSPPSSPPTPVAVSTPKKHEINPPPSTRPAPLVLPEAVTETASTSEKLTRYIAIGRAYLTFYKTGLKNVYHNYRASLPLRKTLRLPAYIPISPPRLSGDKNAASLLGRAQFQLVRRSARDVRRMIPFTLILIVCGEFTPLVVPIFGNAVTPFTCRVPSQVSKERTLAAARKRNALAGHTAATAGSLSPMPVGGKEELSLLATQFANPAFARTADAESVLRACAVFGLVKSHARFASGALLRWVYRPRLERYLSYLAIDDAMIRGGGGVKALVAEEVRVAVEERGGGDVASGYRKDGQREMAEREWLQRWLALRNGKA
ncbi:hypothetical protein N7510_000983 [Penicillium lagena]|uniref:uncharacterized protein n=1 Tax=Penicillium lagena TaxID=94218 RepID=UPI0025412FF2|nr:uncharacterized protein N7510_000983 [Penicillium lagena]KAJ5624674.1 hypothetical protein N7510_000983 [Penicillium lagena]